MSEVNRRKGQLLATFTKVASGESEARIEGSFNHLVSAAIKNDIITKEEAAKQLSIEPHMVHRRAKNMNRKEIRNFCAKIVELNA